MRKIINVVIAAVKKGDKFLMTKRVHLDHGDYGIYHGVWQLPGGELEFGEKPEETLKREMKEETGIEVEIVKLVPKIYTEIRKNWQGIFIIYLSRLKNPRAKIILNDEASDYAWYTVPEACQLKTLIGTTQIMADILSLTANAII